MVTIARGVYKDGDRFVARYGRRKRYLGSFRTLEEAMEARAVAVAVAQEALRSRPLPKEKLCSRCGSVKSQSHFYINENRRDRPGHKRLSSWCKPCTRAAWALYR